MIYQVSHGSKSFGADTVFEDVQFEIKGNESIGISLDHRIDHSIIHIIETDSVRNE